MFCTPSERIEIGRRVFAHELTNKEAAAEYGVAEQSIYQYVREYLKSAGIDAVPKAVEAYIKYFSEGRPSYALGYLTPKVFREMYAGKPDQPKKPSKVAYEKKAGSHREGRKKGKERRWKEQE